MILFTLKDVKSGTAMTPFSAPNEAVAIRDVQSFLDQDRIPNPEDQELYLVGRFDPESMRLTPQDPSHIINLVNLLEAKE